MRKLLLSCSICSLFFSYVCAELEVKPETAANAGAKDFEGFTIGAGLNIGVQKTSSEANREFRDVSTSVSSTMYGGTVTIGYQKAVSGNFTVGIEAGLDFGSDAKQLPVGGALRDDSSIAIARDRDAIAANRDTTAANRDTTAARENYWHERNNATEANRDAIAEERDYYIRRGILQQMLRNTSNAVRMQRPFLGETIIDPNVWQNMLGTLRYLGNSPGISDAEGLPAQQNIRDFMLSHTSQRQGVYDSNLYVNQAPGTDCSIPTAQLIDFVGRSSVNLRELGEQTSGVGGDNALLVGLREIRNFIGDRFPMFATILQNIARQDVSGYGGATFPGTAFGGGAAVEDSAVDCFSDFIGGYVGGDGLFVNVQTTDVGIPAGTLPGATPIDQDRAAADVLLQIFDPLNPNVLNTPPPGDPNAIPTVTVGQNTPPPPDIRNELNMKASFGVCPHIAFKFGYFIKELKACLYAKVGMIQLNGRVTPVNNLYGVKEESFRKLTPFFAMGATKNLDDHWAVSLELSHALQTKKKLQDINVLGYKIANDISISRSNIRIMATYRF